MAGLTSDAGGYRQLRLFSLFGFEVKLDLSWLLLALLISWSMGAGWFPDRYPGFASGVYAGMGVAAAIGVFFSIVLHEFSHSLVARRFGMPIRGITLFVFGGVAEMEKEPPGPRAEFLMAVAGPVASFALAAAGHGAERLGLLLAWPQPVVGVIGALAYINFVLAVFNLIPAFPLDGGRMLRAVLWHRSGDLRSATWLSSRIGAGFGVALAVIGVLAVATGNFVAGMWWVLIGIFLRGVAVASYRQTLLQEVLHNKPVSHFMRQDAVTVAPTVTIERFIDEYVYRHHFKMFPVVDGPRLLGSVSTREVRAVPREEWSTRQVGDVLQPPSRHNCVAPGTEAMEVLRTMARPGGPGRYMVVDGNRLLGVIALKDLLELVALKLELSPHGG